MPYFELFHFMEPRNRETILLVTLIVFVLVIYSTVYSAVGNRNINADQVKREFLNETATISHDNLDYGQFVGQDDSKRRNDYKVENMLRKKRLHLACQNFDRITKLKTSSTLGKSFENLSTGIDESSRYELNFLMLTGNRFRE